LQGAEFGSSVDVLWGAKAFRMVCSCPCEQLLPKPSGESIGIAEEQSLELVQIRIEAALRLNIGNPCKDALQIACSMICAF
jgi:hypothetical protein